MFIFFTTFSWNVGQAVGSAYMRKYVDLPLFLLYWYNQEVIVLSLRNLFAWYWLHVALQHLVCLKCDFLSYCTVSFIIYIAANITFNNVYIVHVPLHLSCTHVAIHISWGEDIKNPLNWKFSKTWGLIYIQIYDIIFVYSCVHITSLCISIWTLHRIFA